MKRRRITSAAESVHTHTSSLKSISFLQQSWFWFLWVENWHLREHWSSSRSKGPTYQQTHRKICCSCSRWDAPRTTQPDRPSAICCRDQSGSSVLFLYLFFSSLLKWQKKRSTEDDWLLPLLQCFSTTVLSQHTNGVPWKNAIQRKKFVFGRLCGQHSATRQINALPLNGSRKWIKLCTCCCSTVEQVMLQVRQRQRYAKDNYFDKLTKELLTARTSSLIRYSDVIV